jgi:hypothetical protein
MTRITQADQIMLLLRQQLQRMAESGKTARSGRTGATQTTQRQTPLRRVSALAALDGLSDEELGQTLIRALLAEEFGETLANEPKFARIVDEVHRMIAGDEEARGLLHQALGQVRQAGGS